MRRYQHSCDQCRRSKRGCDAPPLPPPDNAGGSATSVLGATLQVPDVKPCSYCIKTKKACTMNWAWSHLRVATALEAASRGELGLETLLPAKRPMSSDPEGMVANPPDESEVYYAPPAGTNHAPFPMDPSHGHSFPPRQQHLPNPLPDLDYMDAIGGVSDAGLESMVSFHMPAAGFLDGPLPYALPGPSSSSWSSSHIESGSNIPFAISESPDVFDISNASQRVSRTSPPSSNGSGSVTGRPPQKRQRQARPRQTPSLSPFSASSAMVARSSSNFISSNLLQIYHDVLEHNLSCWLTEASCPYKGARGREEGRRLAEWGPSWSNRIFQRTLKLDKAATSTGLIRLSRSEDRAATQALHCAIMAFATQWAQGSRRQKEQYNFLGNTFDAGSGQNDLAEEMAEGFDRDLQRHFWSQAQKALQEAENVESYKVACAELVFGLAQKPWALEDVEAMSDRDLQPGAPFDPAKLTSEISRVITRDGPPVYLERAARKMYALKSRFDASSRVQRGTVGQSPTSGMSDEDETTVGLLYWLAVMFDTVSSSMNERPVVVTDQDCQHDGVPAEELDSGRWQVELFIKDSLDSPSLDISWPCPYEDAAEAVTRSGPVKVLLYRHVLYLQNMVRRGQSGERVEDIIRSAASLHRYWGATYGAFFGDLVRDFDTVPGRIQSWFFCISAHWHLAALMLADLIERVDDEGLGIWSDSQERVRTRMAAVMRNTSVQELANLARVSMPPAGSFADPQLSAFHHAVNEGAVLTEPWTIILIRAFSKAAVLILEEADHHRQLATPQGGGADELWGALRRADDCIKTLFYLGRKSDMARQVADVLAGAMASFKPPAGHMPRSGDNGGSWAFEEGRFAVWA
ncbi:hypothetical protein F5X68DRAFT_245296 [Plectosphaerella plurivora]|uniref:Zn(2)-C6 fungal-type domain-containing protein n=1 Tax=Plectosphaerella plurivora TaxID=936078 RepID=A0A9P9A5Z8_9PEZI|nr:hypothetical protein F5X68DRAFT_245296 [Plectosphaerella plurivora]